ncbi:acylneuraminate cytidylyltransferase family protein [Clostridium sp. DL1XJH146]
MYNSKKILAIIPARGGSKGILDKNIKELDGKPLINYTIEAAKRSKYIDKTIVSTDSENIKKIAVEALAEVPFIRPASLSDDNAKSIDVVIHTIEFLEENGENFDLVILLQPTSPLRDEKDIDQALENMILSKENSLVSICEVSENPILMRRTEENKLKPILHSDLTNLRRQNLPKFYIFNGAIYINTVDMLKKEKIFVNDNTMPFIMEKEKSIDIDDIIDFKLAELLMKEEIV